MAPRTAACVAKNRYVQAGNAFADQIARNFRQLHGMDFHFHGFRGVAAVDAFMRRNIIAMSSYRHFHKITLHFMVTRGAINDSAGTVNAVADITQLF